MNQKELLQLFDAVEETYIEEAAKAPAVKLPKKRPMAAVAAMLAICLLLIGGGTAYANRAGLFADFFARSSKSQLSQEQLQLIESQEVLVGQPVTQKGWTVELGSVISDGQLGYAIFRVTGPSDVDLQSRWDGEIPISQVTPGDYRTEASVNGAVSQNILGTYGVSWWDDGDGQKNTGNLVMKISPKQTYGGDPFGAEVTWKFRLENLVLVTENESYRTALMEGKYADQDTITFTPEEEALLTTRETLVEGTWEFDVNFAKDDGIQTTRIELLNEPLETEATLIRRGADGKREFVQDKITLTSLTINALSVTAAFDYGDAVFLNGGSRQVSVKMTDGTEIAFSQESGGLGYTTLIAPEPIVLEQAMYLILADGTQVPIPFSTLSRFHKNG